MKKTILESMFRRFAFVFLGIPLLGLLTENANAQCTNSSSYGSATAPTSGSVTISTCSYQEEYSTLNSVAANTIYSCNISAGGYITIHEGSPAGPVVGYGASPLTWTSSVAGTYYAHWNTNAACGTTTGCVTTTIAFIASLPAVPPTPVQDPATPLCSTGSSLSVTGTPGANEVWYWQTSATGTSTAIPYSGAYSIFANGTYYLRAYNSVTLNWSATSSSVTVTNFPTATTPPAPTAGANPACLSTTLTAATAPGGTTYYWQSVANGSSTANPATTPLTATTTGNYYLAAFDNATQCWSSTSSTAVTIQTIIPPAAVVNPTFFNYCTSATSMPVTAALPAPSTNLGSCSASASASGYDANSITATVNNFSCASGTIASASMNASIGTWCTSWYSYNIIVNGVTVATNQCNQTNFDLTPYLPLTSVSIVSVDNDSYPFDNVNMALTVNVNYITAPYTLSWFANPTGGSAIGTGTTLQTLGTSVLPTAAGGSYSFYVANNQALCESATRELVTVNVTDVLAVLNPVNATCNGLNNGSFTLGSVTCGTPPFAYSVDGGAFGPIPTDLLAGTHTVSIQDATALISAPISVVVTEPSAPTTLNASNVTYFNATLGWTAQGDETSWVIEYGPAGFTPGTGTTVTATTNPWTITGLNANTSYNFYVAAGCAAGSDFAGPFSFATDPGFFTYDTQCGPGFTDISASGTGLNLADDASTTITLTSPVTVQNATSSTVTVSNNGWITVGGNTLNVWNTDLDDEFGNVYWEETTIAGDNYLIVEWYNRPHYSTVTGQSVTFEVALNKATGEIYYLYDDKVFGGTQAAYDYAGNYATISATGPTTVTVSYNSQTFLQNNSCIHFYNALCPNVTNFSSIVYADDAIIDWNPGLYNETAWTLVYGLAGFDPTVPGQEIGTLNLTSSDASFGGTLTQLTGYDVYIYSECQADNLTSDGYFYNFTTLPYCSNPSGITVATDVDSLEVAWNWLASSPTYAIQDFNIAYAMANVGANAYSGSEVAVGSTNTFDTIADVNLLAGGVYNVYVQAVCTTGDTSAFVGPITVIMPLTNDTVCGAEMLTLGTDYMFNNTGATVSVDETNIAPPATGAHTTTGWVNSTLNGTTWFTFVAPTSGSVRVNSTANNYNGQSAVYEVGQCSDFNNNFNLLAANDDAIGGTQLSPNFTICGLTPGATYHLMNDGFNATTGNYAIRITEIVLEAGNANALSQICYGDNIDLFTTINGYDAAGTWSAPVNAVNASIAGSTFSSTGLAYQTFNFQYRVTDGCAYDSIVSQVQIFAPSNAGIDGSITVCKNEPLDLLAGLSGVTDLTGTWYDPSNVALPNSSITASAFPGSFNYDYIAGNGICPDDTSNVVVTVLSSCDYLAIEEANFSGVQVYPNPTDGIVFIATDINAGNFSYEVTDANGRVITAAVNGITAAATSSIDLSKVEVGVYFIKLSNATADKVYRIVVQ
jgi:hypothetical protein